MNVTDKIKYFPETGKFVYTKKSGRKRAGDSAGHVRFTGKHNYIMLNIDGVAKYAHRVILQSYDHDMDGMCADHINGDTLDNRLCNLRVVTPQGNSKNRGLQKRSETGIQGVYRKGKGFAARITVNGVNKHIGSYSNIFDAACARKSTELKYGFHANHGHRA